MNRNPISNRRVWLVHAVWGLALVGLLATLAWRHSGWITGDAHTYAAMANQLAAGRWSAQGWVADQIREAYADVPAPLPGPFWNTAILPGGRLVHMVAPGYPLWLALVRRVAGPSVMLLSNHLLLALFALGLLRLLRQAWPDAPAAGRAALALAIPLLLPGVFRQFTGLWREPLFLVWLTAASLAYGRFASRATAGAAAATGFCLGAACAVKEANAIYVPVFALLMACAPGLRAGPRRWRRTGALALAGALAFAAGTWPLWAQNLHNTGCAWRSLYVARETAQYSVTRSGMGFSTGNVPDTARAYLKLLAGLPALAWPLLVLALTGVRHAWRVPVVRLWLCLGLAHLALCLQWGRADLRHTYLLVVPYGLLLAAGGRTLADALGRWRPRAGRPVAVALAPALALFVIAAGVRSWHLDAPATRRVRAVRAHMRALRAAAPAGDVLWLANKPVQQALEVYLETPCARLQELFNLDRINDWPARFARRLRGGAAICWVDQVDLDPAHQPAPDWRRADKRWLKAHFTLKPLGTVSGAAVKPLQGVPWSDVRVYGALFDDASAKPLAPVGVARGGAASSEM